MSSEVNKLKVSVKSAEATLFEGECTAISSINDSGPFDILPMHANFISIVKHTLILYPVNADKKEINLDIAVLKAYNNKVEIFMGIEFSS